jgi:hypothetical protein
MLPSSVHVLIDSKPVDLGKSGLGIDVPQCHLMYPTRGQPCAWKPIEIADGPPSRLKRLSRPGARLRAGLLHICWTLRSSL